MIHLVKVGSSSAAAESGIDWAARQVMDWIYPVSGGTGAATQAQELEGPCPLTCVCSFHAHTTHTQTRWCPLRKTCVTLCRHLDSQDQRQWCIVTRRVDREGGEKTRHDGDSTLIDIRTFVWQQSAYFWSERWVSSNPHFVVGGLMKDFFDGEEWQQQQLNCCLLLFPCFLTQIQGMSSS